MRYIYALYAVISFCLLFLILFPFFFLLSFGGRWGRSAIWFLIRCWSYIWLFLLGISVRRIYIRKPDRNKNYVVVANHISYLDTAMIFRTIPFMVRPLAKKELARLPLFGFLYKQIAILVDRDSNKSKARSVHLLKKVLQQECSIFIFPEGSFNETGGVLKHFYDGAFRIAWQTGTPVLPVLFPDTAERFHYSSFWKWSPGRSRAVFLPEIGVAEFASIKALKEAVFKQMEQQLEQMGNG